MIHGSRKIIFLSKVEKMKKWVWMTSVLFLMTLRSDFFFVIIHENIFSIQAEGMLYIYIYKQIVYDWSFMQVEIKILFFFFFQIQYSVSLFKKCSCSLNYAGWICSWKVWKYQQWPFHYECFWNDYFVSRVEPLTIVW